MAATDRYQFLIGKSGMCTSPSPLLLHDQALQWCGLQGSPGRHTVYSRCSASFRVCNAATPAVRRSCIPTSSKSKQQAGSTCTLLSLQRPQRSSVMAAWPKHDAALDAASTRAGTGFSALPADILVDILAHLEPRDNGSATIASLALLDKATNQLVQEEHLWQRLVQRMYVQFCHAPCQPPPLQPDEAATQRQLRLERLHHAAACLPAASSGSLTRHSQWKGRYITLQHLMYQPLQIHNNWLAADVSSHIPPHALPQWMRWQQVQGSWSPTCVLLDGVWWLSASAAWQDVPPGVYSLQFRVGFHSKSRAGEMYAAAMVKPAGKQENMLSTKAFMRKDPQCETAALWSAGCEEVTEAMLSTAPPDIEQHSGWPAQQSRGWVPLNSHLSAYAIEAAADKSNGAGKWTFLKVGLLRVPDPQGTCTYNVTARLWSTRGFKSGILLDCACLMPVDEAVLAEPPLLAEQTEE